MFKHIQYFDIVGGTISIFKLCVITYDNIVFVYPFQICHSKSGNINPMKIKNLVEAYVEKYTKSNHSKGETFPSPEVNGDSAKTKVTR